MASTQFRWAILLIIISTLIVAVLLSTVVLPYRFKGEYDVEFSQKYPELATLITTKTLSAAAVQSDLTPHPQKAGSDFAIATVTLQPNCTRSALYWVNHTELWPEKIDLGSALFTKTQAQQIIQSTAVNTSNLVFIQFVSAYLNVIHGADPLPVADVIMQASEWLYNHPPGGILQVADAQQGLTMAKNLEEYNAGYSGPNRCLDDITTYTDQMGIISVPVLSMTPSIILLTDIVTPTPFATNTATPTRTPISILVTYAAPAATLTPTLAQPSGSKPTSPPATQAPRPTQPPPQPTQPPPEPTQPPPEPTQPPPEPTQPPPEPTQPPPPPTQRPPTQPPPPPPPPTEPPPPPPTEPPPPTQSVLK